MTNSEILSHIDHTILRADTIWADVERVCGEAKKYEMASVCIPPRFVSKAKQSFPELTVGTVIGFPLGYQTSSIKLFEAAAAVSDGADELDLVLAIGLLKNGEDTAVFEEIKAVRKACSHKCLKVILETCLLTEDEKIRACHLVTEGGADYIKTSTGFGAAGATLDDVVLFRAYIGENVKIKAAGGIRTREQMELFLSAGCERIGTSAANILFDDETEK